MKLRSQIIGLGLVGAVSASLTGGIGLLAVTDMGHRTGDAITAGATREIETLIRTSVEQVERGTAAVELAGKTMGEIVDAICNVSSIVAEISFAGAHQSEGVNEVGRAVTQMEQTTQQNSALVEQSAATAASLSQQAQDLVKAVASFRLARDPRNGDLRRLPPHAGLGASVGAAPTRGRPQASLRCGATNMASMSRRRR